MPDPKPERPSILRARATSTKATSEERRMRWLSALLLSLLLPWLVACSTVQFTYRQGPMLSYWWLDSYVDFSDAQSQRAKAELENWFKWHRATQLPAYGQFLATLADQAKHPVNATQLCEVLDQIEGQILQSFDQAVPAMARIIQSFEASQFDHLAARYAKADKTIEEDYLDQSQATWRAKSVSRWLDNFESFYGRLSEAQRADLSTQIAALPFDPGLWLQERRLRHAEIVAGLRRLHQNQAETSAFEAALRAFAVMAMQSPREGYRAYREGLKRSQCSLLAHWHNQASTAQREQAAAKILQYAQDVRSLQAGAP